MRDGTGKLPTPYSHVDNGYGTETMVYNRKRKEKGGGEEQKQKEERRLKKDNGRKKGRILNH